MGRKKLKKIIYILGILALAIITILNIVYTAKLDMGEHITINFNSIIYIIGVVVLSLIIFFVTKIIDKYLYKDENESKQKIRKFLFIGALVIYFLFNLIWIILVQTGIVGDQIHACNMAQTFYRGNLEEFFPNMTYAGIPLRDYMQAYHQQISLAFVYSILFRIIHFDAYGVLRVLNIICNLLTVVAIYKIGNHISKTYKINKVLLLTLILTFMSLSMLSTFIYGDIPGLTLSLFSVYFMMKYTDTKKLKYAIIASIFIMIAFMMRMNYLIFIIATVIYLLINFFNNITKKQLKENIINILVIMMYIVISIIPSSLVKNYYLNKYNMDKSKEYPNISYFLMAMEEGPRANGWYNEAIGEPALKDPENKKIEYREKIKERLTYFSHNIGYTFEFYITKLASMWTENTYSAIHNNQLPNNQLLEKMINPLTFYQKALLILICICCIIILVQNRKNLSVDIIFLITIFLGGFAFHILWEAKSRYIIPYIIVLIPIAAIKMREKREE